MCVSPLRMLARPMVTMITAMMGSPISGRNTTLSTMIPKKLAKARVTRKATENGADTWVMTLKQMKAPNVMNSPVARLRMLVAL